MFNVCVSDWKSSTFWYLIECLKLTSVTFLCLQVCAIMSLLPSASLADLTCEALLMLSGNVSCKFWTNISWIFITAAWLQQLLQAFKRRSFPSTVQSVCSSCPTVSTLEIELIFSLFHFMAITTKCQTLILSHNFPPCGYWKTVIFLLFCFLADLCSTPRGLTQACTNAQEWCSCYLPQDTVIKSFQVALNRVMITLCYHAVTLLSWTDFIRFIIHQKLSAKEIKLLFLIIFICFGKSVKTLFK